MKRTRLKLRSRSPGRSTEYEYSRWILLHELRQCRAKRRVSSLNTAKETKKHQRDLAKLRKEHPL